MKKILVTLAAAFYIFTVWANDGIADSATVNRNSSSFSLSGISDQGRKPEKFSGSPFCRMVTTGLPLVGGGLVVKGEDDHFRSLRYDYLPQFQRHADDYMQYAPAVVMLGMKVLGIESRSSWGRMLVSDAFSAILMGSVVNTLKQTTHVVRPDGSNNHSFPSGHTATAFMSAT